MKQERPALITERRKVRPRRIRRSTPQERLGSQYAVPEVAQNEHGATMGRALTIRTALLHSLDAVLQRAARLHQKLGLDAFRIRRRGITLSS